MEKELPRGRRIAMYRKNTNKEYMIKQGKSPLCNVENY